MNIEHEARSLPNFDVRCWAFNVRCSIFNFQLPVFHASSKQLHENNDPIHAIFDSDMVLQRGKPITIWGWAAPGASVSVQLGTDKADAKAAADKGRWEVTFPAREASAGRRLHGGLGAVPQVPGKPGGQSPRGFDHGTARHL